MANSGNRRYTDDSLYNLYDDSYWLPSGDGNKAEVQRDAEIIHNNTASACECGAHRTYGKDCPATYHSDYCPLYQAKLV